MTHFAKLAPIAVVLALSTTAGCEIIAAVRGFAAAAGELSEHLENDLKSELTEAKITKVIEVAPKLKAFAETAKHKWQPDPNSADFTKLVEAFGSLAEYMAFFEENGTRLTEFYVDLIKITDARALVTMRKAHAEATAKLQAERAQLEAKAVTATGDEKKTIDEQLGVNKTALENLEKANQQQIEARAKRNQGGSHSYSLDDTEIARVEARLPEIDKAFDAAGYKKAEAEK